MMGKESATVRLHSFMGRKERGHDEVVELT